MVEKRKPRKTQTLLSTLEKPKVLMKNSEPKIRKKTYIFGRKST